MTLTLVKRIFNLFPIKGSSRPKISIEDGFDLCLFNSYSQVLKRQMRFVFQTILFRNYQQGKTTNTTASLFS